METLINPNVETATSAVENAPPLLTDKTNSALGNDKFSEGSSASCKPDFVSEPFTFVSEPSTEFSHPTSAKSSSDQMSRDQPAVDYKADRTSSAIERKHSIGEDSAAMTIEFLRARLSSERTISPSARQQIEELAKKVMGLERNLQAEMERRRLSQIAAEEALKKLQDAGVHLDSIQLDAFVRVFELRKEALSYQDMNTANSAHSESCTNMSTRPHQSVCNMRVLENPKLNDQHNHSNATEADQNSSEPKLNPVNLELEKDKDGEKDDHPLFRESHSLPPVLVRGIGRSCRTFKKKHTSLDIDEPLVESWNDSSKDVAYHCQNQDQQEPEGSDLSGWINCVVDMLDHNSKENFSSSLEDGCTDPGQPATKNLNFNIQQYPSEKDKSSPNPNHKQEFNNLDDTRSTQLSVEQVVSYSCQNAEQSELGDEVKKLLEHRAEFIAWNQSEENAQMLWEQQHPLQSTSEQEEVINDQVLHSCTLQTEDSHDKDSICRNEKQESSKSMTEEPLRVSEGIKELQCVQECMTNNLAKQFESNGSEEQKVTPIVPSEEQNLVHFMHPANSGSEALMDPSVSDINNCKPVDFAALDLNQPTTSDSQSKKLHLGHEHKPSGSSMEAQLDEDGTFLTCTTEVKYCTNDAAIGEGKGMQGQSADLSLEVSPRHNYSQDYGNNSEYFSSNSSGVDSKGGINEERLVGNLTGDNPWDGVPLKADLQRQALQGKAVPESFLNDNISHVFRNSKEEFSQHLASNLEDKGKHPWKSSRSYDPYKDVSNRGQEHENATGANNKRSDKDKALLLKDQLHPLSDPISPWKHANISRPLYEESMEYKHKAVNHIQRGEDNPNPYFVPMSKHDHFQAHNSQYPSTVESSIHVPDDRLQNVLRALRLAKEQIKESTEQRQLISECANAEKKDFYRDYSNFGYNYPLGRDMKPNPPLGYPVMTQNQRGLYKDIKFSDFRGLESGLQNYAPSFNSALNDGFKHYPSYAGTQHMPLHGPLSQGPVNNYVDKLNVGKGIEFFFKK